MDWGGRTKKTGRIHWEGVKAQGHLLQQKIPVPPPQTRLTVSAALSVSDAGDSEPYGEEFPVLG